MLRQASVKGARPQPDPEDDCFSVGGLDVDGVAEHPKCPHLETPVARWSFNFHFLTATNAANLAPVHPHVPANGCSEPPAGVSTNSHYPGHE